MSRTRRVFHPDPAAVDEDGSIALDVEESRHVTRVLRLRPGDPVSVFDGRGAEYTGVLTEADRDAARVRVGARLTGVVDPVLRVVLFPALCRHERFEWEVQKGTELGAAAFRPLQADRAAARPPTRDRLERWRRIAREAAKQSGRRIVPAVDAPVDTAPAPLPGVLALVLDAGRSVRPIEAALTDAEATVGEVWVASGPEGGFDPAELRAMRAAGWLPVSLGPRTLRAETAGICAVTIVLHRLGDLGSG